MSIQEKLSTLYVIDEKTIRNNFTFEDFKFEILEKLTQEPHYDALLSLNNDVKVLSSEGAYNLIKERVAIKFIYLVSGYGFDPDFVNALALVLPLIKLDIELSKIFKDDEIFEYVENTYWETKKQEETTLQVLMETLKGMDLTDVLKELQSETEKIQELVK